VIQRRCNTWNLKRDAGPSTFLRCLPAIVRPHTPVSPLSRPPFGSRAGPSSGGEERRLHAGLAGFTQSAPTTRISVRASQSKHTKRQYSIGVNYCCVLPASVTERSFSAARYGAGPTRTVWTRVSRGLTHLQVQLKAACEKEGGDACTDLKRDTPPTFR